MAQALDLTGDGGVIKTIVRTARPDEESPSEALPLVDGIAGIFVMKEPLQKLAKFLTRPTEDNTVFSFEIGKGSVISAWDIALRTMKVGEVAKITCKSEYAYGSAGCPPDIPPDATLIFEVELVASKPRRGSSASAITEERARLADLKKQRELVAATKEEEKKKREEAKAAAAARIQAKMDAKRNQGRGKGKAK